MSTKELYRITEASNVWTFTSSNEAQTYNAEVYLPKVVGRSEISDKAQVTKGTLDVTFPLRDDLAQHLLKSSIDATIRLDIYSLDEDGDFETSWRGRLTKSGPDGKEIKATFESVFTSNRRVGARPVYQRNCRHVLYGPGCKLSIGAYSTAAHVATMSADGRTLTIPEASGTGRNYNAGVVIMPDGTMRYISTHSGSTIVLIRASDVLTAAFAATPGAVPVMIAPGCTQTQPTCAALGNTPRFGGFPWIPLKNPMGGSSIV